MLPKESVDLEVKREELGFYTNQCWDEMRRVNKDNGRLLRDHFKNMASKECKLINIVSEFIF
jgi:hypothetical protein